MSFFSLVPPEAKSSSPNNLNHFNDLDLKLGNCSISNATSNIPDSSTLNNVDLASTQVYCRTIERRSHQKPNVRSHQRRYFKINEEGFLEIPKEGGGSKYKKAYEHTMARLFYKIFDKGATLSSEGAEFIFQKYLSDNQHSFSIEKDWQGGNHLKINSMAPVISYLSDHQDTKTCNFRVCHTLEENLSALVEFLKKSSLEAAVFHADLTEESKINLASVNAEREIVGGPLLRILYY